MKPTIFLFLFSVFALPALATITNGDFNLDGAWDCNDADDLVDQIAGGTNDVAYDLNGDGVVDLGDLEEWLIVAGAENLPSGDPYLAGDANLDGVISFVDFNITNDNLFLEGVGFCGGDFNADGVVGNNDINILCINAPPGFCDDVVALKQVTWGATKAHFR